MVKFRLNASAIYVNGNVAGKYYLKNLIAKE